jgi:hypothetical protein
MRASSLAIWAAVVGAMLWMVGCLPESATCSDQPVTAQCSDSLDSRERCLQQGGCWDVWGLAPVESCNCPTTDQGKACAADSDCQGMCLIEGGDPQAANGCPAVTQGTCSELVRSFGCFCYLDDHGEAIGICAD